MEYFGVQNQDWYRWCIIFDQLYPHCVKNCFHWNQASMSRAIIAYMSFEPRHFLTIIGNLHCPLFFIMREREMIFIKASWEWTTVCSTRRSFGIFRTQCYLAFIGFLKNRCCGCDKVFFLFRYCFAHLKLKRREKDHFIFMSSLLICKVQ